MAKKGYSRIQRIEDLIQTAMAEIIQRHAEELHIGIVTVTGVTVAQDFSHAKIFVSVLDETHAEQVIHALNEETKNFRYELAHSVKMRVTPELRFVYDDSVVRGNRISSLIDNALKDEPRHDES